MAGLLDLLCHDVWLCEDRQVKLIFDGQEARLAVEWRLTFVERHLKEGQWGVRPSADQLAGQVNQGAAVLPLLISLE